MNGSALYSDVVLPAATWYEKHDLSSTDLHPFVHSFNQAVPPPWEARTDFDIFGQIAERFSELAETHLGTRTDLVASPLLHDTPEELAQPFGEVRDWKRGECEPIPGKTMPKLVPGRARLRRRLPKWRSLGPLAEKLGSSAKGIPLPADRRARRAAGNGERRGRRPPERCPATCTCARRSSLCRASRTDGSRSRGSARSRSERARSSPTLPRSTRTSGSRSATRRCSRAR